MNDSGKLINASDLIKWIVVTYPDWYMDAIRDIYDHIIEMPSAQPDADARHTEKEQAYMDGWADGQKALQKEIWERERE